MKYAENLTLVKGNGYIEARLRNPWDTTAILQNYILIDKDSPVPDHLPEGTLVRTPLSKALVYTGVHCALINVHRCTLCPHQGTGSLGEHRRHL